MNEIRERLIQLLSRYFNIGDSYTYNLTRVKTAFDVGTIGLDDFEEYTEGDVAGLAEYLAGMCALEDVVYETNLENAFLVPAGREVMNSLQLLSSPRYAEMIARLSKHFDVVLVDTPPAGVIVDAIEIAKYCDGALLVVASNTGRKQEIDEVAQNIRKTGCKMLGAVLNEVKFKKLSNKHYYYSSRRYSGYYRKRYARRAK